VPRAISIGRRKTPGEHLTWFRAHLTVRGGTCGGSDGGTPPQEQPASVTVAPAPVATFASIGQTTALTGQVQGTNGSVLSNVTISWTTLNGSVASVSPASGSSSTVTSRGNGACLGDGLTANGSGRYFFSRHYAGTPWSCIPLPIVMPTISAVPPASPMTRRRSCAGSERRTVLEINEVAAVPGTAGRQD
jgi:hypothetical protein